MAAMVAVCSCGDPAVSSPSGADGKTLMTQKCQQCHSLDRINSARYDEQQWRAVIDRMKTNGLVITDKEQGSIARYLGSR
jgi:cytochrome c5